MSTRSSVKNLFPPLDNPELTIRRRSCADPTLLNDFEMVNNGNGDPLVPDLQTMEELCQPTLNGRGGPIAPITIQAMNFGLKNDMIQQVQNSCQFDGLSGDDANKHLEKFLHVTQSIKVNGITDDTLHLRPEECYDLIKNMTAHHNDWDTSAQRTLKSEMAKINKNLMKVLQINQQVKAVTPSCETCGGPHSYNDCPATVGQIQNIYAAGSYQGGNSYQPQGNRNLLSYHSDNYLGPPGFNQNQNRNNQNQNFQNQNRNQGNNHGISQGNNQGRNQFFQGASHGQNPPPAYQAPAYQAPGYQAPLQQAQIPQPQVVTTTEFTNYMKANDAILNNRQTNMTSLTNSNLELKNMFGQFMKMNTASSSGSGTLPSNTVTNPKKDLKGITTRSGNAYQGPTILTTSFPHKIVERETEVTKDTVPPTNNGSTKDVQPPVVQIETPIPNSEPVVAPIAEPVVALANDQKEKFFKIFKDLDFNISFADALILMPKFGPTIKSLLTNKDKLFELARTPLNEHCSTVLLKKLPEKLGDPDKFLIPCDFSRMDECLALADLDASINLMPLSVWNKLSLLELTPTLMTLELADRSISRPIGVAEDVFVKVVKFHFLADFVVIDFDADPRVLLILGRSFLKTGRALIDVYAGELTLRVNNEAVTFNLDQTLRYSANYNEFYFFLRQFFIESEGIPEHMCDVHSHDNSPPLDVSKDQIEDFSESNNEFSSIDDDSFSIDDIDYVEASPPDSELVSSEVMDIVIPEVGGIDDDILLMIEHDDLREKLRNVNLLISKIEALNANPTPSSDCKTKSSSTSLNSLLEETNTFDNSLLEFETFCFDGEEISGGSTTTHPDLSLPEYEAFHDDHVKEISSGGPATHSDISLSEYDSFMFDLSINPFPPADRSDSYEFTDELIPFISAPEFETPRAIIIDRVDENRASWSDKLDDALWAFRTAFKTPIECTPYKLMYGKACHLPIELEHKAYLALKHCNYDLLTAGDHRKVQLNELNELRDQSYENSLIYKDKTKRIYDSKIKDRIFNIADRVLLFNSRLKIFSGKLKNRWSGPFTINQVFLYGTVELSQTDRPNFKVNGHRLKHYFGEDIPKMVVSDLKTFPKDQ
nr:reverse transcriptase domain-containing protein [Tanacetum cinerariifolium]